MERCFYNNNNLPKGTYIGTATVKINKSDNNSSVVIFSNPCNSNIQLQLESISIINMSSALIKNNAFFCGKSSSRLVESDRIYDRVVCCNQNTCSGGKILYSSNAKIDDGDYLISTILKPYDSLNIDLNPLGADEYYLPGSNNAHQFSILDGCNTGEVIVLFVWNEVALK